MGNLRLTVILQSKPKSQTHNNVSEVSGEKEKMENGGP